MKKQGGHSIASLFVLLIFASFLLTAALLISMGTSEYRRIVDRSQETSEARTAVAYLSQKVRQNRSEGSISLKNFQGQDSLCIESVIGGRPCRTYLYVYEGELMELTVPVSAEKNVLAASGTPILPVESLTFSSISDRCLMADGRTASGARIRTVLNTAP